MPTFTSSIKLPQGLSSEPDLLHGEYAGGTCVSGVYQHNEHMASRSSGTSPDQAHTSNVMSQLRRDTWKQCHPVSDSAQHIRATGHSTRHDRAGSKITARQSPRPPPTFCSPQPTTLAEFGHRVSGVAGAVPVSNTETIGDGGPADAETAVPRVAVLKHQRAVQQPRRKLPERRGGERGVFMLPSGVDAAGQKSHDDFPACFTQLGALQPDPPPPPPPCPGPPPDKPLPPIPKT